jgi:hypothetical protein
MPSRKFLWLAHTFQRPRNHRAHTEITLSCWSYIFERKSSTEPLYRWSCGYFTPFQWHTAAECVSILLPPGKDARQSQVDLLRFHPEWGVSEWIYPRQSEQSLRESSSWPYDLKNNTVPILIDTFWEWSKYQSLGVRCWQGQPVPCKCSTEAQKPNCNFTIVTLHKHVHCSKACDAWSTAANANYSIQINRQQNVFERFIISQ